MALSRFFNLERKLIADPVIYEEYKSSMKEYLTLGHMKIAQPPGNYIIPHRAVVKRINGKIKLRVVFDASGTPSFGTLLNNRIVIHWTQITMRYIRSTSAMSFACINADCRHMQNA